MGGASRPIRDFSLRHAQKALCKDKRLRIEGEKPMERMIQSGGAKIWTDRRGNCEKGFVLLCSGAREVAIICNRFPK